MTTTEPETVAERIEAKCRRLMAEHSRVIPRGFDTERERAWLRADIDKLLDQLSEMRS